MEYILRNDRGSFDLTSYEEYLEREGGALSGCVSGDNLLRIERFVPSGPESLHDARFENLTIGLRAGAGTSHEQIGVTLSLRGPYFDRIFDIRYDSVSICRVEAPTASDDLLMHEVTLRGGVVRHELLFDHGGILEVRCRALHFAERLQSSV